MPGNVSFFQDTSFMKRFWLAVAKFFRRNIRKNRLVISDDPHGRDIFLVFGIYCIKVAGAILRLSVALESARRVNQVPSA